MIRPDENMSNPEQLKEAFSKMETPEQKYLRRIADSLEGINKKLNSIDSVLRRLRK